MFLISDFRGIREIDNIQELNKELLIDCANWIYDDWIHDDKYKNMVDKNPAKLFDYCIEKNNFGDIANVYEIPNYCGLLLDVGEEITIKRIL